MKNITKVISSIVGVVGSLAGISLMTACTEEEPTTKYGPPPYYDQCKTTDNYWACVDCCEHTDDSSTCGEDYVESGNCSSIAADYGPLDATEYGPIAP